MAEKAYLQLKELGSKLETFPTSKDALIKLLKQATTFLAELDQSPLTSTSNSMKPFFNAIVKQELLKHQDRDVKLLVATCICEITRITAPEAPYSDEILKDTFRLIVSTFSGLNDTSGPSFGRRVVILETLAKYRSCVVMLDLGCDDMVNEMFSTFFAVARDDHQESVLSSMQTIMVVLLEESEDVREDLLSILLSTLGRGKNGVTMAARRLAMNVIQQCVGKLEPSIKQLLLSLMSGDSKLVNSQVEYHGVIYDLYCCAPQILYGVLPYVTGELLTDQLETRLKAMNLVGDIISLPGTSIPEAFQPIFSEFLKRLSDRVVEVRMSALEHVKNCMLLNPFRAEAPQIISALCERLLDFDENVRKQVVAVICDVACHAVNAIPPETVKLVAERIRDKSLLVKKYTMERLAEVFRVFCAKKKDCDTGNPNEYDWIAAKIVRCLYDKDFRSDIIESVLSASLFPVEFSISDIVKNWIGIFPGFDKVEVKALEKILEQKQRLQQEMQKYLSLRQMHKDKDVPEVQKKILFCFRVMSHSFSDPIKAEQSFQILDQLKDANIWKILTNLVDPSTSLHQSRAYRDDLLKILGKKHRLYGFLNTLCMKCSYLLFNKEHVKAILVETLAQKSAENAQRTQSCMDLLVIIARFCPLLLSGSEEELVNLLKDSNDMIKEGILNVLAKAGATIREQLAVTSSSVDLILERLCLEGSRRQAKYAVHALVAITKDDGLKSLSVLYKKLVDILEEKAHLPAVLQSLGCIAQTAMPVFETRESEIKEFITNKILRSDSKEDHTRTCWEDKSDLCMLKIYGLKTLVKSYLPVKDAHIRPDINSLLGILNNILSYGEISKDLQSSSVDKAHLRLASAKSVLRLSRLWDQKIPVDLFHLTLRASEISFAQAKKAFLSKVHQYIKDRLLDAKYACAFLFNTFESKPHEFAEDKQNLADIIQLQYQTKARQISMQSDANSLTIYPEYIIPYLVHALAHISCPSVDECKDVGAYDNIYRQLHLVLSVLLQRDEASKSEVTTQKEKDIISTIASIFQSIKLSEDMVHTSKTKNSHAICDLGLAITKQLVQKDVDLQELSHLVSLPPMLYKVSEKKEGDDTMAREVKSWLADDTSLTHFESIALEMVRPQLAEGEASKDKEEDENEIPLGKMIERIKSQGIGGKKVKKIKSVPAETNKDENDFDMLNMVKQINVDNLASSTNVYSSNGHEQSLGKKTLGDPEHATGQKRKTGETTVVPLPKRRRSSSAHEKLRLSTSTLKASRRVSGENSPGAKLLLDEEIDTDTESKTIQRIILKDLLVSPLKQKIKGSESYLNDELNEHDEHDMKSPDDSKQSEKTTSNKSKSTIQIMKKSKKRKSIAGLTKCTSKEGEIDIEDLIGCRIKVWWPSDKKFYRGTIKSYDPLKGKHVILYDDGDVEILRLERECWELIDKGRKSTKKRRLNSREAPGQKRKDSSGSLSRRKKTIVNGKQSPSKHVKHGQKHALQSYFQQEDGIGTSEISNPEETATSKADEINLEFSFQVGSEKELTRGFDEITTHEKKSKKKVRSVSRGKRLKKNKSLHYMEESDEGNQDYSEKLSEGIVFVPQYSSEEREVGESSEALRENANGEEESDPEGHPDNSDVGVSTGEMEKSHTEPSSGDGASTAEISDDVPLSKWKRPKGKKGSGKTR